VIKVTRDPRLAKLMMFEADGHFQTRNNHH